MNLVEPIRDLNKVKLIQNNLLADDHHRDWLMFTLGLNLALRISDLLKLKVDDVYDNDMVPKNVIVLKETKTGSINRKHVSDKAIRALYIYKKMVNLHHSNQYLFKSRNSTSNAIDRTQAYRGDYK